MKITRIILLSLLTIYTNAQEIKYSYVITEVDIIPMTEEVILKNQMVFINNGIIEKIEPFNKETSLTGYHIIDGRDKYLIPGLVDSHQHFISDDRIAESFLKYETQIPLYYGVTRARVPIGNQHLLKTRKKINNNELLGQHLYVGSPQIAAVNWSPVFNGRVVKTKDEAYKAVEDFYNQGYDFLKITFALNKETYTAVIEKAKELNIKVTGHVPRRVGLELALESGHDVDHLDQYMDAILSDDSPEKIGLSSFGLFRKKYWETAKFIDRNKLENIIEKTCESGVWNIPTEYFFSTSFGLGRTDDEINNSPENKMLSTEVREWLLNDRKEYWKNPPKKELREIYVNTRRQIIKGIYNKCRRVLAGSDSPEWMLLYGKSLHRELQSFVAAGLTPYQALETATSNASRYFRDDSFGIIAPRKIADLILLDKNPLEDIKNAESIDGVFLKGKFFNKTELLQIYEKAVSKLKKATLRTEFKNQN